MRRIVGSVFQSLDGVMQAPGGPTEDPTGGFAHGGWMFALTDDAVGEAVGDIFSRPYALLLGRKTYEIFAAYWPHVTGDEAEFARALTAADKYVLTRGDDPLMWDNSHRLRDIDAVAELKTSDGPDLLIQGSSTIYTPLLAAGLIDRITTLTFPVLLGRGKRIFGPDTPPGALRMLDHRVSPRGTVIATYEPAGNVPKGGIELPDLSARERTRQARMAREG